MDAIVSPSGFLADLFAKVGFHVQPIFNIIDMRLYRYRKRRKLRPIFLRNRILEPLYNIQCTLRAFAIIFDQPEFRLHAVSLLECFASGLPVIATNVGGIPYIASNEETALLVPCNDHEAMAERAIRLLESEALVERLTERAYEECKRYCAGPSRDRRFALYRKLMGLAPTSLH